jgi:hypothetical protein
LCEFSSATVEICDGGRWHVVVFGRVDETPRDNTKVPRITRPLSLPTMDKRYT